MAQQLKQFLLYLTVEKNASPYTVTSYSADVESFFEFAKRQGVSEALFANTNQMIVRAYLGELKTHGYARSTIARRIASLRSFFRFLVCKNLITNNPVSGIYAPKFEMRPSVSLNNKEIKELLGLPGSDLLGQRDAAILELLYASGIRISELVDLTTNDIDLVNQYLLLYGSEFRKRVVPIGRPAVDAVEQYLEQTRPRLYRHHMGLSHDKIFVNKNGGPLTDRSVRRLIMKYVNCLAVSKEISPQSIRYTFATHLLENGANVSSVKEMLGQANLSSKMFDNNDQNERLRSVYKHAHPRA
ncbi:Tyrosine recombinase XerC [bioreactor metagenome]|uniref:Tyrosine recombinase XerC n=1 Tax=bioreactor metagenome TaxID=1076179 RepID=A0A644T8L5_9ZZZZ|nr:tyrosine-type recombinase/integrase [Negativicutes bacterium]